MIINGGAKKVNNYIYFNESQYKSTPFKINNSSEYNNNMSQGSFNIKTKEENITKKFVADFCKNKKDKNPFNIKKGKMKKTS